MDQRQGNGSRPVGGRLLKGAGFVIGLATELHAHNKAKKSSNQSIKQQIPQISAVQDATGLGIDAGPLSHDEAITFRGSLDSKPPMIDEKPTYVDNPLTMNSLPYPVILPQRRPNDKSRGFVRAYAPDLGRYKGIDEPTFLNFLKQFHKSSQASGFFTVINIAAMGASFAPGAIAFAVTISVQMASRVAAEAQSRHRTNSFLDKANEELFHPRNLHCMIMTFKPEASGNAVLNFDIKSDSSIGAHSAISQLKSVASNASNTSGGMMGGGQFRTSDGVTKGEFEIPQSAHLVYPITLSSEALSDTDETGLVRQHRESSWKSTGKFLADYKDRRAQAKFAIAYGDDSKLAIPGASDSSRFASRFSDPNVNPFDFISGRGQSRNGSRDRKTLAKRDARDRSRKPSREKESSQGLIGGMKGMMQQDILYLLIAEIPSEGEMRDIF